MAKKRLEDLRPAIRERKVRWYEKHQGLSAEEVRQRYNAGTLGSQKAARGHANTPEKALAPKDIRDMSSLRREAKQYGLNFEQWMYDELKQDGRGNYSFSNFDIDFWDEHIDEIKDPARLRKLI